MNNKDFQLTLRITIDEVRIITPSGKTWKHPMNNIPNSLYEIIRQVLLEDAALVTHIANTIKRDLDTQE